MAETYIFSAPKNRALNWLLDPGPHVEPHVKRLLRNEILQSQAAVVAGLLNGIILNAAGLFLHSGSAFAVFILVDVVIVAFRLYIIRRSHECARIGKDTPTDLYVVAGLLWCGLQGSMAATAMLTGVASLQILAATTVMGLIGPIAARNYAAPRYAMALVILCDVPFVLGAGLTGDPWMLILVVQTPLFYLGVLQIIRRYNTLALKLLLAEHESDRRARHDPLTGLANRFGWHEVLEKLASNAPYAIYCLDLDGFKLVNDRYGHLAGDLVLQGVAERLNHCLPSSATLARTGGDEFLILVPDTSVAASQVLASTIVDAICASPFDIAVEPPVHVGVSIGYAVAPFDGRTTAELQIRADQAMYRAKQNGHGLFCRFEEISDLTLAIGGASAELPVRKTA